MMKSKNSTLTTQAMANDIAKELGFPEPGAVVNGLKILEADFRLKNEVFQYFIHFPKSVNFRQITSLLRTFYNTELITINDVDYVIRNHDYGHKISSNMLIITGEFEVIELVKTNPIQKNMTALEDFDHEYSKMEMKNPETFFRVYPYRTFNSPAFRSKLFSFVSTMGENYGYCNDKELFYRRASLIMPKIKITKAPEEAKMMYHTHPKKDEPSLSSADDYLIYFDLSHQPRNIRHFFTVMADRMDYFHITPKKNKKNDFVRIKEDKFIEELDAQIDVIGKKLDETTPAENYNDDLYYCEKVTKGVVKWLNKKYSKYFTIKYKCYYKVRKNPGKDTYEDLHLDDEYIAKPLNDIKSGKYSWPDFNDNEKIYEKYSYWHSHYFINQHDNNALGYFRFFPGDERRFSHFMSLPFHNRNYSYWDILGILLISHDIRKNDSKIRDGNGELSRIVDILDFLEIDDEVIRDDIVMLDSVLQGDVYTETAKMLSGDHYFILPIADFSIKSIEAMEDVKSGTRKVDVATYDIMTTLSTKMSKAVATHLGELNRSTYIGQPDQGTPERASGNLSKVGINPPLTKKTTQYEAKLPTSVFENIDLFKEAIMIDRFDPSKKEPSKTFGQKEGKEWKGSYQIVVPYKDESAATLMMWATGTVQMHVPAKGYELPEGVRPDEIALETFAEVCERINMFVEKKIPLDDIRVGTSLPARNPNLDGDIVTVSSISPKIADHTVQNLADADPNYSLGTIYSTNPNEKRTKGVVPVKDGIFDLMEKKGELITTVTTKDGRSGVKKADVVTGGTTVLNVNIGDETFIKNTEPNTDSYYVDVKGKGKDAVKQLTTWGHSKWESEKMLEIREKATGIYSDVSRIVADAWLGFKSSAPKQIFARSKKKPNPGNKELTIFGDGSSYLTAQTIPITALQSIAAPELRWVAPEPDTVIPIEEPSNRNPPYKIFNALLGDAKMQRTTPHEFLYWGGKQGQEPTGYWTSKETKAIGYAVFGDLFDKTGDIYRKMGFREGMPIMARTRYTNDGKWLAKDPETGTGDDLDIQSFDTAVELDFKATVDRPGVPADTLNYILSSARPDFTTEERNIEYDMVNDAYLLVEIRKMRDDLEKESRYFRNGVLMSVKDTPTTLSLMDTTFGSYIVHVFRQIHDIQDRLSRDERYADTARSEALRLLSFPEVFEHIDAQLYMMRDAYPHPRVMSFGELPEDTEKLNPPNFLFKPEARKERYIHNTETDPFDRLKEAQRKFNESGYQITVKQSIPEEKYVRQEGKSPSKKVESWVDDLNRQASAKATHLDFSIQTKSGTEIGSHKNILFLTPMTFPKGMKELLKKKPRKRGSWIPGVLSPTGTIRPRFIAETQLDKPAIFDMGGEIKPRYRGKGLYSLLKEYQAAYLDVHGYEGFSGGYVSRQDIYRSFGWLNKFDYQEFAPYKSKAAKTFLMKSIWDEQEYDDPFQTDEGDSFYLWRPVWVDVKKNPPFLTPAALRKEPNTLFVFGDNDLREGKGGQAINRDEPNAVGFRTKKKPNTTEDSYYSDKEYNSNIRKMQEDLNNINRLSVNYESVYFMQGIGEGRALLKEKAPKTYQWMQDNLPKKNPPGEIFAQDHIHFEERERLIRMLDRRIKRLNKNKLNKNGKLAKRKLARYREYFNWKGRNGESLLNAVLSTIDKEIGNKSTFTLYRGMVMMPFSQDDLLDNMKIRPIGEHWSTYKEGADVYVGGKRFDYSSMRPAKIAIVTAKVHISAVDIYNTVINRMNWDDEREMTLRDKVQLQKVQFYSIDDRARQKFLDWETTGLNWKPWIDPNIKPETTYKYDNEVVKTYDKSAEPTPVSNPSRDRTDTYLMDIKKNPSENKVIIVSGPSASGKSTAARRIAEHFDTRVVPTYTTRPLRPKERVGGDRVIITPEEFEEMIDNDEFQEYSRQKNGHYYGRRKSDFDGMSVIDLSLSGANKYMEMFPDSYSIYLIPDKSPEKIKERLISRGGMSEEEATARSRIIGSHIESAKKMPFTVFKTATTGRYEKVADEIIEAIPKDNPIGKWFNRYIKPGSRKVKKKRNEAYREYSELFEEYITSYKKMEDSHDWLSRANQKLEYLPPYSNARDFVEQEFSHPAIGGDKWSGLEMLSPTKAYRKKAETRRTHKERLADWDERKHWDYFESEARKRVNDLDASSELWIKSMVSDVMQYYHDARLKTSIFSSRVSKAYMKYRALDNFNQGIPIRGGRIERDSYQSYEDLEWAIDYMVKENARHLKTVEQTRWISTPDFPIWKHAGKSFRPLPTKYPPKWEPLEGSVIPPTIFGDFDSDYLILGGQHREITRGMEAGLNPFIPLANVVHPLSSDGIYFQIGVDYLHPEKLRWVDTDKTKDNPSDNWRHGRKAAPEDNPFRDLWKSD